MQQDDGLPAGAPGDGATGFGPAPNGTLVTFSLVNNTAGASFVGGNTCTTTAGTCTVQINSSTAGSVNIHATTTFLVGGVSLTRATGTGGLNSADANKVYVDANIQITPRVATNPLDTNHTLTGHVNVNDGTGFENAPEGTTITFEIVFGPGLFVGPNSCLTVGVTGSCTAIITSSTSGITKIRAKTDVGVGGLTLHRETGDELAGDSDDALKSWANARISIAPSATNEVGHSHTFTVLLEKDNGSGTFVPAPDGHVTVTLTDANGANHSAPTGSCTNAGPNTDQNGQCTITFLSDTAGTVTGHAAAFLFVDEALVAVATNGLGGNSPDAVKTFVDANIQITPQAATNPVGTNHTLTGHVNVNGGSGGFVNAPEGTAITFEIVSGPGHFVGTGSCLTVADTGSCTAVISSSTSGVSTIRVSTDVQVGGVMLHRETGDEQQGDGDDATKTWATARIAIASSATNEVGQSHTFTVTLEKDTGTGTFVPVQGEHVSVTLTDANGATHAAPTGSCTNAGPNTDADGKCAITFVSNTAGTVTGHASATIGINEATVSVDTNGADAVKTFVDANIQITPPSAINPVGKNHTLTGHVNVNTGSGAFQNAPAGTAISFTLTGTGSFVGPSSCTTVGTTGSCTVVIVSSATGTSTVRAKADVTVGGVVLHRESSDAKAGDSGDASKLWADATGRTDILNATGGVVTTVVSGTVVHDKVFVDRLAGTPAGVPNPTGNVIFHRYATIDCTGAATDQTVALTAGAPSTALSADFAPTATMSYKADYLGDANYPAQSGACEPLTVTPVPAPAIAIVKNPKSQTVAVGGTARFTITVTNAGNTVLTNVTVTDPLSPNCNRTAAQLPALASMAPGAAVTYTCSRPNTQRNFDNVATATGTPPAGTNMTASDTAPVKVKALRPPPMKHPKVVSHKRPKTTG